MADQVEVVAFGQAAEKSDRPAGLRSLANRNFRLLWMGESVSLFGDQFYFVALPWLVFQMTGSSLAFGTILMVAGIPRAVLMLVGGVLTDRFSPRAVMIVSNLLRLVIILFLTLVVAGQSIQLWMLYVIAFCFGVVDAFFHPAYRAMLPVIVGEDDLRASNSLMLGASQLVQTAGPGIAGVLVNSVGMVLSFAFDALTFLFTAITLLLMRPLSLPQKTASPEPAQKRGSIFTEIGTMLAYVRQDRVLPTLITIVALVNLLFGGPLVVGSAALSKVRFVEGSAAYGAMLSAFAVGMLIGTLIAGTVRTQHSGQITLYLLAMQGLLMAGIGFAPTLIVACGLWLLIGCGSGFGNVHVITITQKHITKEMIGRVMSVIVLAEVGLGPISNALAGVLADLNLTVLFVLAGGLLTLTAVLAATNPDVRAAES